MQTPLEYNSPLMKRFKKYFDLKKKHILEEHRVPRQYGGDNARYFQFLEDQELKKYEGLSKEEAGQKITDDTNVIIGLKELGQPRLEFSAFKGKGGKKRGSLPGLASEPPTPQTAMRRTIGSVSRPTARRNRYNTKPMVDSHNRGSLPFHKNYVNPLRDSLRTPVGSVRDLRLRVVADKDKQLTRSLTAEDYEEAIKKGTLDTFLATPTKPPSPQKVNPKTGGPQPIDSFLLP